MKIIPRIKFYPGDNIYPTKEKENKMLDLFYLALFLMVIFFFRNAIASGVKIILRWAGIF